MRSTTKIFENENDPQETKASDFQYSVRRRKGKQVLAGCVLYLAGSARFHPSPDACLMSIPDSPSLTAPLLDIIQLTTDLVWLADTAMQVLAINQSARAFFGISDGGPGRATVGSFLRGEAYQFIRSEGLRAAMEDGVWSGDLYFPRHDGVEVPVSVIVLVHRDDEGAVRYWSATARDITALRETEQALQQAVEREQRLTRLQSRFINTLAREFRNPISMILSSLELLVRSRADPAAHYERMKKGVRDISALLDRGLRLLDGVDDETPELVEAIDLADFAREVAQSAQQGDGRVVHVEVPQRAAQVRLDAAAMRTIAGHLLANALKFSTTGSLVSLKLAMRDYDTDSGACQLVMYVRDRGIGIPEDDQPFIFERFYRAYNRPNVPGLGAGLYHVKRLVERMHGKIECYSRVGEGTEFVIMVPVETVPANRATGEEAL
jgi:PAS domain S-box-containing protein